MRKSNVLRPQPHLSTLESSMGHRTNGVEGFKVITVHPHHRSSLLNHIPCGTMFQPLTKDHGDDNQLAVTSAGSGDDERGLRHGSFRSQQKGFCKIIQCNYCQFIQSPLRVREYRRVRRRVRPPGARDSYVRGVGVSLTIRRLRPRDGRSRFWIYDG